MTSASHLKHPESKLTCTLWTSRAFLTPFQKSAMKIKHTESKETNPPLQLSTWCWQTYRTTVMPSKCTTRMRTLGMFKWTSKYAQQPVFPGSTNMWLEGLCRCNGRLGVGLNKNKIRGRGESDFSQGQCDFPNSYFSPVACLDPTSDFFTRRRERLATLKTSHCVGNCLGQELPTAL